MRCTPTHTPSKPPPAGLDGAGSSARSYETPQVALNCGIMLRECIRYELLAKVLLQSQHFHDFFDYVEMSTFDIASDAFATFKVRLRLFPRRASRIV